MVVFESLPLHLTKLEKPSIIVMVIIKQLTLFIKFLVDIYESKIAKAKAIRVEKENMKYLGYIWWADMLKSFWNRTW